MSRCKRGGSISDPAEPERRDGDDDDTPSFFDGEELVDTFIAFVLSSMEYGYRPQGLFYGTTFLELIGMFWMRSAAREKVVEVWSPDGHVL